MAIERAVLAGGCFWGMQDLIRKRPGITSTRVGYTGGEVANATYRNHGNHAEGIEIMFDNEITSYRQILEFFFQIHDPSTVNRQGNDKGTSYRSAIYYTSEAQHAEAVKTIADVDASGLWPGKVVTEVEPASDFWEAEAMHQDYLELRPNGYTCHFPRPDWKLPSSSLQQPTQTCNLHTTTTLNTIGLGGGCHWCTEGVFSSLIGIATVNQGWIASIGDNAQFSEAIEVVFDPTVISLSTLIEIHLHTHASTSNHSMRGKYRSAIYAYDEVQYNQAVNILDACRADFEQPVITQVYFFKDFKANKTELIDYFYTAPNRPFCQRYIHPKLTFLLARFSHYVDTHKLTESGVELTSI